MKIVIIHQYYLRPAQGGGARFNVMAKHWAEQGHDVLVIAGQVDYTTGQKAKTYNGTWRTIEHDGDVTIWRMFTPDTYARNFFGRAMAFVGFALSAMSCIPLAKSDIVIASSPSLMVALPGLMHQWIFNTKFVFEVRDLWPESAVATGVLEAHHPITRSLEALEHLTYKRADAINAVSPAIAKTIKKKVPNTPVWMFPNGANLTLFDAYQKQDIQQLKTQLGWHDRFVVLYAGAHGLANDLNQMVEAAKQLKDHPHILLVALGDGPQKRDLVAKSKGMNNVQWLDPVTTSKVPLYFLAADATMVLLQRNETFKTVYPNKLFDAMAAKKPIICGVDGAARTLVESNGCGLFVPPERPDILAQTILQLSHAAPTVKQMGERGRRLVEETFDRERVALAYLEKIETLEHKS